MQRVGRRRLPTVHWLAIVLSGAFGIVNAGPRHVPSPDWRDQVIYFAMIDRFDDGDPTNDDQGAGEFDPSNGAKYSGGDLRGLERRLDYIRDLGATTLWITPPVANRWWDPEIGYGGYHGYWAEDFSAVDAHYGTLADYRALAEHLHAAGMYLVQDIVVNHTGNFFTYGGGWNPADPVAHFRLVPDAQGRTAPRQPPFDRNDVRRAEDRRASIYHWTPAITDYRDLHQQYDFQLADLDDLNTGNPVVREALRATYGNWIRDVGVDGFRVDTAFYVPPAFFRDFLYSQDRPHPGILEVARQTGRKAFHVFGEGFGLDKAYDDTQARRIDAWMRDAHGPLLPGMLDFPLYGTLGDVFARGRPTAELGYRLRSLMARHANPWLMPSFIDNHDVERFRAGGSEAALKQALLALMTLPGIPVIYYGTEQGFTGQRAAMFKAGFESGGADHFDADALLYRYLRRAIDLRRGDLVFSRGTPVVLHENHAAPGAFAYRMEYRGQSALVAFNTSDHAALLDALDTGLPAGRVLRGAFAIEGTPADLVAGSGGRVSLALPPRSGLVWMATPRRAAVIRSSSELRIAPLPETMTGDFDVHGRARGVQEFRLVTDGDLATSRTVRPDPDGRWSARIDTGAMIDPSVVHRVVAWSDQAHATSAARSFHVARRWKTLVDVDDPDGDDHGPAGRYVYPADPGWRIPRPLDIEHVRVSGAGGALRIEVRMHALQDAWNPPNGFDHVAFTIFLDVPGRGEGTDMMPLQNARLPRGMRWNLRLRAHGWSNLLFSATGASATAEGTPVTPVASISVDPANNSIAFTLPAHVLGGAGTLSGARLYVSTWDMDAAPRPLQPEASPLAFGGGDGTRDPLVMDDSGVITLR